MIGGTRGYRGAEGCWGGRHQEKRAAPVARRLPIWEPGDNFLDAGRGATPGFCQVSNGCAGYFLSGHALADCFVEDFGQRLAGFRADGRLGIGRFNYAFRVQYGVSLSHQSVAFRAEESVHAVHAVYRGGIGGIVVGVTVDGGLQSQNLCK